MPADLLAPAARFKTALLVLLLSQVLAACDAGLPPKITLLAPFEGQYREIGYNALYAIRLAFADAGTPAAQFLAVDDGGTIESAVERVKALNIDPAVVAIFVLGPAATHPAVQTTNDKPLIIIGNWGHDRSDEDSLYAASPDLAKARATGDLSMLSPSLDIRDESETLHFASSGALPDVAFRERYVNSALYAPPPNLLATLTYDIARLTLAALASNEAPATSSHHGITGAIRFKDGYWVGAPVNRYRYKGGELVLSSG
ncbi:MAG: hypothetical protein OXI30_15275 [Chloroflexota bacterium]|nr:hypothetical protein [Chloroflexota bacterium]